MSSEEPKERQIPPGVASDGITIWCIQKTYLTRGKNAADFTHHRLIAAKVGCPVKDEAEIIPEVVPFVLSTQLDREAYDPVLSCCELHQPSAQGARRDDVLRDIIKIE